MPRPPPPGAATVSSGGSMIGLRQGFEILSENSESSGMAQITKMYDCLVCACLCVCVRVCVYVVCVCVNNLTSLKKKKQKKTKAKAKPQTPQLPNLVQFSFVLR